MKFRIGGVSRALAIASFALILAVQSGDAVGVPQLASERIVSGLNVPSYVTAPPGDSTRLFITELNTGKIYIYKDGALLPTPFLRVPSVSTGNERGLLSMAFHPDYTANGYFYVFFTSSATTGSHVTRYTVSANPDVADSTSAANIISFPPPQSNHIGGWLAFGPDRFLYISKGDALNSANSQNLNSPLGKILRIDVDGAFPFAIPPSNPYAGEALPKSIIWCRGFRNPWRCSFDRATGDFFVGEVGNYSFEEIDYQPAASVGGENYGWPMFEGNALFDCPDPCDSSGLTPPLLSLAHSPDAPFFCAVAGGYVYRGADIPWLTGTYFYGDFCAGQIWSLRVVGGIPTEVTNRGPELDPMGTQGIDLVISFGEDARGEMYICDYGGGEVFKIIQSAVGVDGGSTTPDVISLSAPAPNPLKIGMSFRVGLASEHDVSAAIFDMSGRRVRSLIDRVLPRGSSRHEWDARNDEGSAVVPGVYVLRVVAGGASNTRVVTVVR